MEAPRESAGDNGNFSITFNPKVPPLHAFFDPKVFQQRKLRLGSLVDVTLADSSILLHALIDTTGRAKESEALLPSWTSALLPISAADPGDASAEIQAVDDEKVSAFDGHCSICSVKCSEDGNWKVESRPSDAIYRPLVAQGDRILCGFMPRNGAPDSSLPSNAVAAFANDIAGKMNPTVTNKMIQRFLEIGAGGWGPFITWCIQRHTRRLGPALPPRRILLLLDDKAGKTVNLAMAAAMCKAQGYHVVEHDCSTWLPQAEQFSSNFREWNWYKRLPLEKSSVCLFLDNIHHCSHELHIARGLRAMLQEWEETPATHPALIICSASIRHSLPWNVSAHHSLFWQEAARAQASTQGTEENPTETRSDWHSLSVFTTSAGSVFDAAVAANPSTRRKLSAIAVVHLLHLLCRQIAAVPSTATQQSVLRRVMKLGAAVGRAFLGQTPGAVAQAVSACGISTGKSAVKSSGAKPQVEDVLRRVEEYLYRCLPSPAQSFSKASLLKDPSPEKLHWALFRGHSVIKKQLFQWLVVPQLFRKSSGARSPPSGLSPAFPTGILLTGPPGSGKTCLARSLSAACGLRAMYVKAPSLLKGYVGESEACVRRMFFTARSIQPCLLIIDELDALAHRRKAGAHSGAGSVNSRVLATFLNEMDGVGLKEKGSGEGPPVVVVVGISRQREDLDEALLRPGRFEKAVDLGPLEEADLESVVEAHLSMKDLSSSLSFSSFTDMIKTGTMNMPLYPSQVALVCREAVSQARRRHHTAGSEKSVIEEGDVIATVGKLLQDIGSWKAGKAW